MELRDEVEMQRALVTQTASLHAEAEQRSLALEAALRDARAGLLQAQIFVAASPDFRSNPVYVSNMCLLERIDAVLTDGQTVRLEEGK